MGRAGDAIGERDAVEEKRAGKRAESRRIPVSTYTASDSTSSARKITSRSVADAISIMPAMAKSSSA
jgi:hypothetical protein